MAVVCQCFTHRIISQSEKTLRDGRNARPRKNSENFQQRILTVTVAVRMESGDAHLEKSMQSNSIFIIGCAHQRPQTGSSSATYSSSRTICEWTKLRSIANPVKPYCQ